ncbi:MAG TPA: Hsp70 family protein [Actinophytocola sp.]|uniref:Hsp70 family protein n=1 Tax=Actinophytocola sp. TaxID=1872138 RepID=UPI002DBA933E|nr:Hsp70 family protein [Actinophytocola sp.]HEU5470608.1 Hsp70 family protein [Actinophytocola sp.]
MPYVLGVDVGSGHTTAALRGHDDEGAVVLQLDAETTSVESVLYLTDDDTVLVGRDAVIRAEHEPERVSRGFAGRVGDPVAPLLAGRPCPAEILTAALIAWVADRAVESEGSEPDTVVVTHPAGWGPHRRSLLGGALRQAGLTEVLLLPKPVAAAECHAAAHPPAEDDALAVFDLGEHDLACAVTRYGQHGFALLSRAEPAEHLGGSRFDDLLTGHVLSELGVRPDDLDPFDDAVRAAMADLRLACRVAKEKLTDKPHTVVPTAPFGPAGVQVTRARLAGLIGPVVQRGVDLLQQTVRAAGREVGRVILTGGSARVPTVAELVRAAAPGEVSVDPEPETAVARGAALAGWRRLTRADPPVEQVRVPEQREEAGPLDPDAPTQPPRPPVAVAPLDLPRRRVRRRYAAGRSRRRAG